MPNMPACRVLAALLVLAQLLVACNASAGSPAPLTAPAATLEPTATTIPTPEPTPTPAASAYLADADVALRDGDWDAARGLYQQALQVSTDPADQAAAQFGMATTLLRAGQTSESVDAFTGFLAAYPEEERAARATYLRAVAREQLGQTAEAVQDYQTYLTLGPGVLNGHVEEKLGDLRRTLGAPLDAITDYRNALAAPRLGGDSTLHVKIGRALMEADDPDGALAEYDALAASTSDPTLLATLNYLAGLALEEKGETAAAQARYLDSVQRFPDAYDTYSGLVRLVEADVPVDPYLRGYIDYQAGAYEPARLALDRAVSIAPTAPAHYYRALSLLELGDAYGAIEDLRTVVLTYPDDSLRADAWLELAWIRWTELERYDDSVQTYLDFVAYMPTDPQAAQGLYDAGRVAERSDNLAWAAEIWLRLPVEYAGTSQAYDGAFQAGIAHYRLQAYDAALSAFQTAEGIALDTGSRAAALLWVGKARQELGDSAGAAESWQAAASADPTGYYSLRASDLLAGRVPFQSQGVFDFTTDSEADRLEAEAWLRSTFTLTGPEPLSELSPALAADARLTRAEEYLRLGLYTEAKEELESLRGAVESDPEATYRLMHKLLEMEMYPSAIFAARQVLRLAGMDDAATASAPDYFNHIRFAPYFGELILPAAAETGFDPLFVLSVVRQESLFEGYATSYAEARGLMQVIPSTGAQLAEQLGWPPGYADHDLYRPAVSVRFGTAYLAEQRDRFGGDLVAALAAYNGGPGSAMAWREQAGADPDLFLEVIRYEETRTYVRQVSEFFARYRDLYAAAPAT